MHSPETRVYTAILTGLAALAVILIFFLVTIIRFQRKKTSLYRNRLAAEIATIEQERSRIARDLHDDLGSALAAIKLKLHCLEPERHENMAIAEQSGAFVDEAMRRLRSISFNIMPGVLQRNGLKPALDELFKTMQSGKIKINASFDIPLPGSSRDIHIYRIIQEIITNSLKHANATLITLTMKRHNGFLLLHITDNGTGFNQRKVLKQGRGQGLQNIISRAGLLDAAVFLTAGPGKGVDYEIKIPEYHEQL
ncbi:sensor histidine kinase [Parafilimonas sp.]|uniref:sensor histidine kinase n=1 Tax=Parafilimonas sp. TaxID=1969739 RepID=UPI003F7E4714